jgi:cytochrome c biogenesis protein
MTDVHPPQSATAEENAAKRFSDSVPGAVTGPPVAGRPASDGLGWPRWAWRQLTTMRTALVLLFLLALASVPGSLFPQEGPDPAQVQQYFTSHPAIAPWLNRLGLFNVFASPWFAAIYILLFTSLVGCVVPRTFRLVGSARTPPPRAPRFLKRLPLSAS